MISMDFKALLQFDIASANFDGTTIDFNLNDDPEDVIIVKE